MLSGTVARVRELVADPDATTPQLVAAIDADESFSANLLRYANSALYARPLRARTIHQAVTMVGRDALARIATESATYSLLEQLPGAGGRSRGAMHLHAVSVAACAIELAQRIGASRELAHLAGLLHDVGKLVMPLAFGEEAVDEIARERPSGSARVALERERLGVDHAFAGALLCDQEGVRGELFQTISFHHGGLPGPESPTAEAACVQLANVVVAMLAGEEADQELVHVALARLGADAGDPRRGRRGGAAEARAAGGRRRRPRRAHRLARAAREHRRADRPRESPRVGRAHARPARGRRGRGRARLRRRPLQADQRPRRAPHGRPRADGVARVLARHGDAGRLGGDEFALWIACDAHAAERAAGAIVAEIAARLPGDGQLPAVTVSIGVALTAARGRELRSLLEAADNALYEAKAAGRARAALAG